MSLIPIRVYRVIRGQTSLLIYVARALRCGFQQGTFSVLLIEWFHRYRTPDLRRLPFLWLDRNCFPNLFDGYCLPNLWSGLCCLRSRRIYACRVARRRYPMCGRSTVTILIFRGFRRRLRRRVRYHCRLDRIIWVMVSYKRRTFYG